MGIEIYFSKSPQRLITVRWWYWVLLRQFAGSPKLGWGGCLPCFCPSHPCNLLAEPCFQESGHLGGQRDMFMKGFGQSESHGPT